MNIDVINKQVSKHLGVHQTKVEMVNRFFWTSVHEHVDGFSPRPINIPNICVFYPNRYRIKILILRCIKRIRNNKYSTKFKKDSAARQRLIDNDTELLRKLLKIRKENNYVN